MSLLKWVVGGIGGIAVAGVVTFGALGGGAVAQADGSGTTAGDYENRLAQQLGISVEQLKAAQKAAFEGAVNDAQASGQLTPEQAAKLKDAGPREVRQGLIRRAAGHLRAGVNHILDSAAKTIGISKPDLVANLKNGQSLAEVAANHQVSRDQLKSGITADVHADLAAAVGRGDITQQRADRIMNALNNRLDKVIDRTHQGKR